MRIGILHRGPEGWYRDRAAADKAKREASVVKIASRCACGAEFSAEASEGIEASDVTRAYLLWQDEHDGHGR